MLKEITIENFKPFGTEQTVPLAPITLIYGPNSSGKSSIIQALLLLCQSFQGSPQTASRLIFRGEYVDLGSFYSVLYHHDLQRSLKLKFRFSAARPRQGVTLTQPAQPAETDRIIRLTFDVGPEGRRSDPRLSLVGLGFSDLNLLDVDLIRAPSSERAELRGFATGLPETYFGFRDRKSLQSLARYISAMEKVTSVNRQFTPPSLQWTIANESPPRDLMQALRESRISSYSMLPGQVIEYLDVEAVQNIRQQSSSNASLEAMHLLFRSHSPILSISREFYDLILSLSYLGPLRSPPERHYINSGSDRDSVGTRGERMPQLLNRRPYLMRKLNEWFRQFGIPYVLDTKSVGDDLTGDIIRVALTDQNKVAISPSDVGFGIGQLLPILVEGTVSLGKLICVEQPEIHLHPRMQAQIADFLIETAKVQSLSSSPRWPDRNDVDVGGNQWIIETHSESLMLRIKRRIKEGVIPASFFSVIYIEPTDHGSRVLPLRLDEKGAFVDEWPDGFFEEGFNEIFGDR
jgi:hypothetical protein